VDRLQNTTHCRSSPALPFFGLLLVVALPANPQVAASFAQLNGALADPAGEAIMGAAVTLRETETNRVYATQSGGGGRYWSADLPSGYYELSVAAPGFTTYTRSGIYLSVGQTATIDLTLQISSRAEQIVVTAEAPAIEPGRTEISQVVDTRQIEALPSRGRNGRW